MKEKRKLWMRLGAVVVLGACLYLTARGVRKALWHYQEAQPRADADASIQVANLKRFYDLHIPASYDSKKPTPLVLAFHGAYGDGKAMEKVTRLNQISDKAGFIAVYPDAIPPRKHWDARRGDDSKDQEINDVGFISALIDDLGQKYNLDRSRIYVVGISNGGMFAQRVACELSDKVTAIAAVVAAMPSNLARKCTSTKPISVLMINGTNDDTIPYSVPGKALLSVPDTVNFWRKRDRCTAEGVKASLPNSPHVQIETYGGCAKQTNVTLYTLKGGEHGWGDDSITGPDKLVKPGQEINESEIIWDFFSKHSTK